MSRNSSSCKAALPYAEALIASSQDMRILEETSGHLKGFLINPLLQPETKKNVIRNIFIDQVNQQVLNFLYVLVDRRRILLLEQVVRCYFDLLCKIELTLVVEVSTALPMNKSQKQTVADKLKWITNSNKIELTETVKPELMGGLVITMGSKVIDMSVIGQLNRMSDYLMACT